jgi:cytochrome c oxidase assembly protein subunit 17
MSTKKKPCCDCPFTKNARDECMFQHGDESKCKWLIEAHGMCMGYTNKENLSIEIQKSLELEPRTPKKKICCSCPETKKARDACIVQHGQENEQCGHLIEAHKLCLRNEGFQNV